VLRNLLTDTGVALPELICKLITRIEWQTREQIIRLAVWSVRGLARGAQRVVRESRRAGRSQSQKLVRCLQSGSCARERSRWVAMAADGHPGVRIDTGDVKLIDMVRDLIWQYVAIPTENELIATWPSAMSDWWRDQWSEFKSLLQLHPGDNCKVWTDWYEDRLDGRMIDRAIELDRATIPDDLWKRNPAIVNAHIEELTNHHIRTRRDSGPPDPHDHDAFNHWLSSKPHSWAIVIAARAALRVLPMNRAKLEICWIPFT
jgi:hypothetical protein